MAKLVVSATDQYSLVSDGDFNSVLVFMKLMVVILLLEFHVKSFKAVYKEITLAVFDMDPSSAAGPDGFNGYINHHCWNFIQQDV